MPDIEAIPKAQLAGISHTAAAGTVIEEIPVVQAEDLELGQALVKILYSGVCYSDLHLVDDDWGARVPRPAIVGHEGVGIVVAKNDDLSEIKIGDIVGIKYVAGSCNQCDYCYEGEDQLCLKVKYAGLSAPGTFQQYCPSYTSQLTPIPDGLDLPQAAPILCAGVTVYRALKDSGVRAGDWVAIPGAGGGLGTLAIQYAKAMGMRVIAVDSGKSKQDMCKEMGADVWIDYKETKDIVAAIKAATPDGRGPSSAIVTAPAAEPYQVAMAYIRPKGSVMIVGLPGITIEVPLLPTVREMKRLQGVFVGNRLDALEALRMAAAGLVKVPVEVKPLSELEATYERMRKGEIAGRVVIDMRK